MSTALTVYLTNTASTTLSSAEQLYSTAGSPSTGNHSTTLGSATGWGEVWGKGTGTAWAAGGSIGSPTGNGFLFDVTTLEGNDLLVGAFTATIRLQSSGTGSVAFTCDVHVRAYKYNGGTYTAIADTVLATQVISTSGTNVSPTVTTTGSNTTFTTGDKLYLDIWLNVTVNAGASTEVIKLLNLSTDTAGKTGNTTAQLVTPGYQASSVTNNNMSSTDLLTLTDSFLATDTGLYTDALTLTDASLATDTGLSTDALTLDDSATSFTITGLSADALTIVDSFLATDMGLFIEALTLTDSYLATGQNVTTEANTLTDSFLSTDGLLSTEALTLADMFLASDGWQTTDLLILSDSFLASTSGLFTESLILSVTLRVTDGWQAIDGHVLTDSFSSLVNNLMASTDMLVLSDSFLATNGFSIAELLTLSDAGGLTSNSLLGGIVVVALGRDGLIVGKGHDGLIVGKGR